MDFVERYGPWALVTGASEGTGAAFARLLAAKGMNLILVARREGPLDALASEIREQHKVQCITATVDLCHRDAAAELAEIAGDREVGLLITNAGADTNGAMFLDTDIAHWNDLVTLNVTTTMGLAHHFGRQMRARQRGGMILVSSGACYGGLSGISVYSAAKGFVLNLAEALWAEMRHDGVDVLTLVLGRTDTPAHRRLMERNGQPIPAGMAQPDDVAETGLRQLPHGPIWNWGQPNDVAGMAPTSPDQRRERIVTIERASAAYAGKP
ncbi:MAG: SDR family NAD(P)-dependent oxidoreductase [Novosphingobium sp.]